MGVARRDHEHMISAQKGGVGGGLAIIRQQYCKEPYIKDVRTERGRGVAQKQT